MVTMTLGSVLVETTSQRGFTPEELADRAVERIIHVGGNSHPAIREQAEAFKQQIRSVIVHYMKEAIINNNVTVANKLTKAGYPDLAEFINKE